MTEPQPPGSTEDLFSTLYRELHSLAERQLHRQGRGMTLGTTTLLHELYLNLADRTRIQFPDRARFLGYASRAMRGLIVDYARRRKATKRGGEFHLVSLEPDHAPASRESGGNLDDLSEAIDQLSTVDPELAELVDLHFFCGLSFVEIAALRGVSDRTVQRDWQKARLVLHRELSSEAGPGA
ncbi:MAG TPA: ECF-type sigma factor [Gemmatimonadales bacterium]|nr:ECF-type sigma factor [Gemmatimonadales bacterium]